MVSATFSAIERARHFWRGFRYLYPLTTCRCQLIMLLKNIKHRRGFALTQILLAVALGASAAAGVVTYYHNVAANSSQTVMVNKIVQ